MKRADLVFGVLVTLVVAFAACERSGRDVVVGSLRPRIELPPDAGPTAFDTYLAGMDERIGALRIRADQRPDDWLVRGRLADILLERAGATGDYDTYAEIGAVLDEATAIAPSGSGPVLTAAQYNFAIHRLDAAERHLDTIDARPTGRSAERVGVQLLRAQIALQRGQYDDAYAFLSQLDDTRPGAGAAELALYFEQVGEFARAESHLEEALCATRTDEIRRRAWLRLQLGSLAMSRGAFDVALDRYQEASRELPGWWVVDEHLAQLHDAMGDHGKAIDRYAAAYERAKLPHLLDALAGSYQHVGRGDDAKAAAQRSAAAWRDLMQRFPEAAIGHGLDHELHYGTPEKALEMARENFSLRPNGAAHVTLARAYLQTGHPNEAAVVAERALQSPYRSAALHDVAARAQDALGNRAEADVQMRLSIDMNPRYTGGGHVH